MAKTKLETVVLSERDLEILAALEKWGVLGLGQLDGLAFKKGAPVQERIGLFFNETDRRMYTLACYKRLRDLELAGYLKGHFYVNHSKVFSLTERGHIALLERGRGQVQGFKRGISEALLTHELAVNGVGLILGQILGLSVRSEFERTTRRTGKQGRTRPVRRIMPDLWIMGAKHPNVVEVELTQKSEARYKELWSHYAHVLPYGTNIFYLTSWPEGVECLLKLTDKYGNKSGGYNVYIAGMREFRESGGRCAFVNHAYYDPLYLRLAPRAPVIAAAAAPLTNDLPLEGLETLAGQQSLELRQRHAEAG